MEQENQYLESLKLRNYDLYKYFKRGLELISILKTKMFEAYIVGGAVRDFVLNVDFKDIDIATNATPDEVIEVFQGLDIDDRYRTLGSVVIRENGFNYEITTFRNEEYVKYKIKDVHYSKKLAEDIIRRDFTINALALTPNLTIIDLVDGLKDLEKGVVRVIGSGKRRFQDDPSRILRGLKLVSEYNFTIDSRTEKAMRKCQSCLKEISLMKLTSEIDKILKEKYAKKALTIIDDNNLLRQIPKYAYWISLVLRYYKKLSYIEKYTLLFLITGELPKNIEASKELTKQVKTIYELAQMLSVSDVDQMKVFIHGQDLLLSADRVQKAYNSRYHKQARLIKKINRKIKIKNLNDMDFKASELVLMLDKNEVDRTNSIMDQLLKEVISGKLPNKNDVISERAKELIKPKTIIIEDESKKPILNFFKKKQNEELRDQKAEQKLYEKIYEEYPSSDFDAWDQIPIDESYYEQLAMSVEPEKQVVSNSKLIALKEEYDDDFLQVYKIYIKGVKGYYEMSSNEQQIVLEQTKKQAKDFLLNSNPKYRILEERDMI